MSKTHARQANWPIGADMKNISGESGCSATGRDRLTSSTYLHLPSRALCPPHVSTSLWMCLAALSLGGCGHTATEHDAGTAPITDAGTAQPQACLGPDGCDGFMQDASGQS